LPEHRALVRGTTRNKRGCGRVEEREQAASQPAARARVGWWVVFREVLKVEGCLAERKREG